MPAMLWIFVLSIASWSDIGGMMVAIRFDNIDLPEPGGPIISRLWPPATATSMARLTWPCPLNVGRREVDRGPAARPVITTVADRRRDAITAFLHCRVR